MEIYLIRHGSTELNEKQQLRGWLNPELSDLGRKQSRLLANYLRNEDVSKIYSSDLIRASESAEMIGDTVGLDVEITNSLRPINFGDLQGKELSTITPQLNKLMETWQFDPNIQAPNGESFRSFQDRTYNFITGIIDSADKNDCIFLVTHIRVCLYIASLVVHKFQKLEGKDLERLNTFDILPGNYLEIKEVEEDNLFRISGVNQIDQDGLETEVSPEVSAAGT